LLDHNFLTRAVQDFCVADLSRLMDNKQVSCTVFFLNNQLSLVGESKEDFTLINFFGFTLVDEDLYVNVERKAEIAFTVKSEACHLLSLQLVLD
jgi:hypothetical protein